MFQRNRHLQQSLQILVTELTDLRAEIREKEARWAEERKQLLDRIMTLTVPGSVREMARQPARKVEDIFKPTEPRRMHFPGRTVDTRPPSPPRPGLSDNESIEVITKEN